MILAPLLLCAAARVVDGDTIACSAVGRVRTAVIEAPDKVTNSVCRLHIGNHVCDDAKSAAATAQMVALTQGRRITYRQVGFDAKYRRVVAMMYAGRINLQCAMLKSHTVRYLAAYDRAYNYPVLHRCRATVAHAWR